MRVLALVLLLAVPAQAQEPTPLKLPLGARPYAARAADLAVIGATAARGVEAWRSGDRRRAFLEMGCEAALALGAVEVLKRVVGRERPDHSDRLSFPSGHTAYAQAMGGWRVSVPVAALRQMAARHYLTDTVGGFLIGLGASRVCR